MGTLPNAFINNLTPQEKTDYEISEKSKNILEEIKQVSEEESIAIKLDIYRSMSLQMLDADLTDASKKILAWFLFNLGVSEISDTVIVSKKFLPTDIGCTPVETKEGFRLLYEKGLIEKVSTADIGEDRISVKLVVEGMNDSKYPVPYNDDEKFGHPGLRINGEITIGNLFLITLNKKLNKALSWLSGNTLKLQELKEFLQNGMKPHNVYIENIEIGPQRKVMGLTDQQDNESSQYLKVQLYYLPKSDEAFIEYELKKLAEEWVMQHGLTI